MCWGSSPSSAILQSCCQEFAALREHWLSQQQGDSQDPLSHLSSPPSLGARRETQSHNIAQYHTQVPTASSSHTSQLFAEHIPLLCTCLCYTKSSGSCIKTKGNSTKYHSPEALCCSVSIQKGLQL